MADEVGALKSKKAKRAYKTVSDNDKKKFLEGNQAESTHKATEIYIDALCHYLKHEKNIKLLEEVLDSDLPQHLLDFYVQVKLIKGDTYSIKTLKCIRAALNRHFKKERHLDIIADPRFIETNEIFKGVTVQA